MSAVEDLAEVADVEGDLVDFSRLHEHFPIPGFAKARPADCIHNQNRPAVRIDVGHANDEIGIRRSGRDEQFRPDFAGPLDRRLERIRCERPHAGMLFMLAGIARAGEGSSRYGSRVGGVARVRGRAWACGLPGRKSACAVQVVGCLAGCHRPIRRGAPLIRAHHVVADYRVALHARVDSLQVISEPADHVFVQRKNRIVRVDELPDASGRLGYRAMQPRADQKLLLAARTRSAMMLTADVAFNRSGVHEVVPTAEREARDVHLVEVTRGVLLLPIFVVRGVLEYRMDQVGGVFRVSRFLERHEPRRATSAVA